MLAFPVAIGAIASNTRVCPTGVLLPGGDLVRQPRAASKVDGKLSRKLFSRDVATTVSDGPHRTNQQRADDGDLVKGSDTKYNAAQRTTDLIDPKIDPHVAYF